MYHRPNGNELYTSAQDELLIKMWRDGARTADIGVALKKTKNSIISRARRLMDRGAPIRPRNSPIMRGEAANYHPTLHHTPNYPIRAYPKVKKLKVKPTLEELKDCDIPGVPFGQAHKTQCAWPLWHDDTPRDERKVCGRPGIIGGHYCEHHTLRAYTPRRMMSAAAVENAKGNKR